MVYAPQRRHAVSSVGLDESHIDASLLMHSLDNTAALGSRLHAVPLLAEPPDPHVPNPHSEPSHECANPTSWTITLWARLHVDSHQPGGWFLAQP